jgi:hypothetical protein
VVDQLLEKMMRACCDVVEVTAEKRFFCALRFAARMPRGKPGQAAAARNCYFESTYGTTEVVP